MENKREKKSFWIFIVIAISIALMGFGAMLAVTNFARYRYLEGIIGLVLAIGGLVLLCWFVASYNKFVRYRNKVDESLALIDVQLKQRFDLIPNLVSTVKGYAKHEKEVFESITELRAKGINSTDTKETIDISNQTLSKLKQIVAIAEDYPKLQADKLYHSLMEELVLIEDKIVASRRFYDSNVNIYNTSIEVWPGNMVAKLYGFERVQLFRIDAGERFNVNIHNQLEEK